MGACLVVGCSLSLAVPAGAATASGAAPAADTAAPLAGRYCPYAPRRNTAVRTGPGASYSVVTTWTTGHTYLVPDPQTTRNGYTSVSRQYSRWVKSVDIGRTGGQCAE